MGYVINNNLEQQADALYQTFFSPKSGTQGKIVTLDEYCSIFTGKKNANASVNGGKYKFFTCAPEALQIDSYILMEMQSSFQEMELILVELVFIVESLIFTKGLMLVRYLIM